MELGAQLFTVRDYTKDLDSFAETLKKTADIGYKNVQVSATCDFEGEWLKEQLDKNGLKCVVTHTPKEQLLSDPEAAARKHSIFDCDNVGLGYYKFGDDCLADYKEFKRLYMPVAKRITAVGKRFMYHNHNSEFKRLPDGKRVIDCIIEDFPENEIGFILDTFWIQAGGGDPAQWIEKLKGRIPCIHLKDFCYRSGTPVKFSNYFAVVGEGNINFDRVFEKAESSDVKYMLVEQDDCYGEDPFECLKRSYQNLCSYGFR